MHTPSVEEDGVCHGEDWTGLPPPLNAALQPSCEKRMLSTPAHGQEGLQSGGWRSSRWQRVALGGGRSVTATGNGHQTHEQNKVYLAARCPRTSGTPGNVFAAKKLNLA